MNIGLKKENDEPDFIGSGFFIKDDSFDGLVQKVKDKRIVFTCTLFRKSLHGLIVGPGLGILRLSRLWTPETNKKLTKEMKKKKAKLSVLT